MLCSKVRGKAIKKRRASSSIPCQKKERPGIGPRNPVNKSSAGNIYVSKDYEQLNDFCDGEKYDHCKAFISNTTHISNGIFSKRIRPENNLLFDERFDSNKMDPRFSPFCQSLETKAHASSDPILWNETGFAAYSGPYSHCNLKSTFERSERSVSTHGGFPPEIHIFCQPSSPLYSHGTPVFTTHGSGLSKPDFCMVTDVDIPQYSSPSAGSWREAKEETLGNGDKDESEFGETNFEKLELKKEACIGNNDLSSEDGRPIEGSDTMESCGTSNKVKEILPEMEKTIETDSRVHMKEKPSSSTIINKSGKE